jgi:hypothetical protein
MASTPAEIQGSKTNFCVTNGAINTIWQDQTSQPLDAYFAQSVSNFTLSADTGVSGILPVSFVYSFEATAGHAIVVGNEILLLDVANDRSFYATVIAVAVNTITVDRPIDHNFPALTSLGRRVLTNMNVDGSATPQTFSIRAGATETDITRILITITDAAAMDDGKFGSIAGGLARGLVFRIVNSYQKTIFCFKTNGEIKNFCYDGAYTPSTLGPSGAESFSARITFAGPSKHGVALRIGAGDVLQIVVQDNLTTLDSIKVVAQGHDTED